MGNYAHFSRDPGLWEESTKMLWGSHDICPSLSWFQVRDVTWSELLALSCAGEWGDTEKPQCNMAYLLIVPGKTIEGEIVFGLNTVWAHPYQACLPSMDQVARKLPLLISIGNNWVYTFVWLNKGALHVPLSIKGHVSAMINGTLSRSACRHLCQLQVQKLLQMQEPCGVPGRLKWGARASAALHPTTTHVGYKYHWWACLQVFTTSGGPPMANARWQDASPPRSLQSINTSFLPTFAFGVS